MESNTQHLVTVAPNSVEVSKNAKGEIVWTVKVYDDDEMNAVERVTKAIVKIKEIVA